MLFVRSLDDFGPLDYTTKLTGKWGSAVQIQFQIKMAKWQNEKQKMVSGIRKTFAQPHANIVGQNCAFMFESENRVK